jgi:hypothetical protein
VSQNLLWLRRHHHRPWGDGVEQRPLTERVSATDETLRWSIPDREREVAEKHVAQRDPPPGIRADDQAALAGVGRLAQDTRELSTVVESAVEGECNLRGRMRERLDGFRLLPLVYVPIGSQDCGSGDLELNGAAGAVRRGARNRSQIVATGHPAVVPDAGRYDTHGIEPDPRPARAGMHGRQPGQP